MRLCKLLRLLLVAGCCSGVARAQLQVTPGEPVQSVIGGVAQAVNVMCHNPETNALVVKLRTQLSQASSTTTMPVGEPRDWKELQVLPGQTVIESNVMQFPAVKSASRFLVQWMDDQNKVLGHSDFIVYPTNLLKTLKPLVGEDPLGVFDPENQLKPLLKNLAVDFEDLEAEGLESFSGKLAVIGPFKSKSQIPDGLARRIDALAKKNVAIVWIQPPREEPVFTFIPKKLQPSFYLVQHPASHTALVVVQADLESTLPDNPRAQLNLVYFCQLALNPRQETLPDVAPQP